MPIVITLMFSPSQTLVDSASWCVGTAVQRGSGLPIGLGWVDTKEHHRTPFPEAFEIGCHCGRLQSKRELFPGAMAVTSLAAPETISWAVRLVSLAAEKITHC